MKRALLFFILLGSGLISCAQYKVKLDARSSVTFPARTQQMDGGAGPITYSTLDKDNKVMGMATVIEVAQFGVDSVMIAANYNNDVFIDLIVQSLLGQYPDVRMISKKKIARDGEMGYEFVLQNDKPDDSIPYKHLYAQIFFAGSKVYAQTVLTEDGVNATEEREQFFNSLKID